MFVVALHELAGSAPALGGQAGAVGRFLNTLNTNAFLGEEMRSQNSRFRTSFQCPDPPSRIAPSQTDPAQVGVERWAVRWFNAGGGLGLSCRNWLSSTSDNRER